MAGIGSGHAAPKSRKISATSRAGRDITAGGLCRRLGPLSHQRCEPIQWAHHRPDRSGGNVLIERGGVEPGMAEQDLDQARVGFLLEQVGGKADAAGQVVIRRKLKRRYVLAFFQKLPPCLVGIEACASGHYWARELQALGHTVRLMPPAYVKPYVKRQKNDMADAEAICEAVTRASLRT